MKNKIIKKKNSQKSKFFLKITLFSLILYLILNEIKDHTLNLQEYKDNFNLNFFLLAIFFYLLTLICSSNIFYLLSGLVARIKYLYFIKILFTSQFLDYFPFLGLAYRAKKFKDDIKLGYTNFLSIYLLLLLIGLFVLSLSALLLLFFNGISLIKYQNYYIFIFPILIIIFFILLGEKLYHYLFKKYFNFNFFNKKINIFDNVTSFINLKNKFLNYNFCYVKCIILDFVSHTFFFLAFLCIFKSFGIEINVYKLIFIYLFFALSTQIKILPKNYGIDELIGSYLIQMDTGSFAMGLLVMVTIRLISLISTLFLFFIVNVINKK